MNAVVPVVADWDFSTNVPEVGRISRVPGPDKVVQY